MISFCADELPHIIARLIRNELTKVKRKNTTWYFSCDFRAFSCVSWLNVLKDNHEKHEKARKSHENGSKVSVCGSVIKKFFCESV